MEETKNSEDFPIWLSALSEKDKSELFNRGTYFNVQVQTIAQVKRILSQSEKSVWTYLFQPAIHLKKKKSDFKKNRN